MNEVEGIRYIAFLMKQFHDQAIESFSYPVVNEMNESGHDDDESYMWGKKLFIFFFSCFFPRGYIFLRRLSD
jgi:hypothetical protein